MNELLLSGIFFLLQYQYGNIDVKWIKTQRCFLVKLTVEQKKLINITDL